MTILDHVGVAAQRGLHGIEGKRKKHENEYVPARITQTPYLKPPREEQSDEWAKQTGSLHDKSFCGSCSLDQFPERLYGSLGIVLRSNEREHG